MKTFGLYKKEKLCSTRAIELLFAAGVADFAHLCYPLRVVARRNRSRRSDAPIAFLISIPKKRLHHAVDRVKMRRRIREAFRLGHHGYPLPAGERIDVAFIYVADKVLPYATVDTAVRRILKALSEHFGNATTPDLPKA